MYVKFKNTQLWKIRRRMADQGQQCVTWRWVRDGGGGGGCGRGGWLPPTFHAPSFSLSIAEAPNLQTGHLACYTPYHVVGMDMWLSSTNGRWGKIICNFKVMSLSGICLWATSPLPSLLTRRRPWGAGPFVSMWTGPCLGDHRATRGEGPGSCQAR